jgi:hypothetical protein
VRGAEPVGEDGRVRATTRGRRGARLVLAGAVVLGATACGAGGGEAPAPPVDPVVKAYCDTVARVQTEQAAPGAHQGGVRAAATAVRRQLADLVRTAPPQIAGDWRTVQALTERSLAHLEATRGDARRINHAGLEQGRRAAEPAQARIKALTEQRCGIAFRAPS